MLVRPEGLSLDEESLGQATGGTYSYPVNQSIKKYSNEGKYIYLSSELLEKSFNEACLELGQEFSRMILWSIHVMGNRKYPPAWYDYMLRFMNGEALAPVLGLEPDGLKEEDGDLFPKNYLIGGFGKNDGGKALRPDCTYIRTFGRWFLSRYGSGSMKKLYSGTQAGIPALGRAAGIETENLLKEFALHAFRAHILGNKDSSILGYDAKAGIQPFGFTVTRIGRAGQDGTCTVTLRTETVSGSEHLYIIAVQDGTTTAGGR